MNTETRTQLEAEFAEYWERKLKNDPSADYTTCEGVWIAARTYVSDSEGSVVEIATVGLTHDEAVEVVREHVHA